MKTKKEIILTEAEIQSGSSRVDWAEGLILQLHENHDGRNAWLLNYGKKKEAQELREKHILKEKSVNMAEPETMNWVQALAMIEKDRSLEMGYINSDHNPHKEFYVFDEFTDVSDWNLTTLFENQYTIRKRVTNLDRAVEAVIDGAIMASDNAPELKEILSKYIHD